MEKIEIRKEANKIKKDKLVIGETNCCICGFEYSEVLNQHHVVPVSREGDNSEENLIFVCPNCHTMLHKGISILKKFHKNGFDNVSTHKEFRNLKEAIDGKLKEKAIIFYELLYKFWGDF